MRLFFSILGALGVIPHLKSLSLADLEVLIKGSGFEIVKTSSTGDSIEYFIVAQKQKS